jgi:hypothetical protein
LFELLETRELNAVTRPLLLGNCGDDLRVDQGLGFVIVGDVVLVALLL